MDKIQYLNLSEGIYGSEIFKLFLAVVLGCVLGFEREIKGKSAGLRTLALICFGSTIFTICSYALGVETNRDRIAANIITGVGFIGAGAILRNNGAISGLTTAASIWIAASVGMLVGIGDYKLAIISVVFALLILYALDYIQFLIDDQFQHRYYKITSREGFEIASFYEKVNFLKLKLNTIKVSRIDTQTIIEFEISGRDKKLSLLNEWFFNDQLILSFEW